MGPGGSYILARMSRLPFAVAAFALLTACGSDDDPVGGPDADVPPEAPDAGHVVPPRPAYNEWIKVEPPGAVCGNDSQYKFWVRYSDSSNNVVISFEPGGACWDY